MNTKFVFTILAMTIFAISCQNQAPPPRQPIELPTIEVVAGVAQVQFSEKFRAVMKKMSPGESMEWNLWEVANNTEAEFTSTNPSVITIYIREVRSESDEKRALRLHIDALAAGISYIRMEPAMWATDRWKGLDEVKVTVK